jgi:DNA-binding response OmpR family regulator
MKILVADDDEFFREMAEDILTEAGHDVILAADGLETLEKAVSESPELIVLDIIRPGLLGTEVSEKLREHSRTSTIPILLVSSRFEKIEEDEDLLEYFKADDFLKKPFPPEELLERVNQLAFGRTTDPSGS